MRNTNATHPARFIRSFSPESGKDITNPTVPDCVASDGGSDAKAFR
jgi:hypothetical protein